MIQSISGMSGGMMAMQGAQGRPGPEKAFSKFDADGDGALNAAEMQNMSNMMADKMGEAASVEDIMATLDGDGDGALSFAEFEAGRPQGRHRGGPAGGTTGPDRGFAASSQMDLSILFAESDESSENSESEEEFPPYYA